MSVNLDWKLLLSGALVLLVAAGMIVRSCTSAEDRIKSRFDELCELNELSGKETPLQAGLRAKEISEYFTSDLTIKAESAPISVGSLREFRQIVFRARTSLEKIDVDPRKMEVVLGPDGDSATMTASIRIYARGMGERQRFDETFNIDLVKQSGEWKISTVRRYETIRLID